MKITTWTIACPVALTLRPDVNSSLIIDVNGSVVIKELDRYTTLAEVDCPITYEDMLAMARWLEALGLVTLR